MSYQVGDLARVDGTFSDIMGNLIDPTALSFVYTPPSGTDVTLIYGTDAALIRDSIGEYHVDINLNEVGLWKAKWISTGTGQAAEFDAFLVYAQGPETWSLVTLERAKQHLRIINNDQDDDIEWKLAYASDIVMNYLKLTAVPVAWTTTPFTVEAAVLLVLGELFNNREAKDVDALSSGVASLLHRMRDPAFA